MGAPASNANPGESSETGLLGLRRGRPALHNAGVERALGTLQDRLVKELRLAGISTIEAANAWVAALNQRHKTELKFQTRLYQSR
jgi:hypothetical protein